MALSLQPSHLRRYRDIAHLLVKYGRSDLVREAKLAEVLRDEASNDETDAGRPDQLAADLEALGPTFVKLGQLLSSRPDLLPPAYLEALARLQDEVKPFPYVDVERVVEEELGVRVSKAFQSFERRPVAAASLGQVHRAQLRDERPVAVKVQRPGIRATIRRDLEALDEIAGLIDAYTEIGQRFAFRDLLGAFRTSLLRELDYYREAQHLATLAANLADYDDIVVPQPVEDYTSSRVLTMQFVHGTKIGKLGGLGHLHLHGRALAESLSHAYLDQILVHGFVHADPHPGNVFVTDDYRLALLDLGMVTHIGPEMQNRLLKLLLAVSEGRGEEVADLSVTLGRRLADYDEMSFRRAITDLVGGFRTGTTLKHLQVGRVLMEVARLSADYGVRPSPELAMLGKTLLNLDEVTRILAPDFDPNDVVRSYSTTLMRKRLVRQLAPGNVFSSMLEVNELVQKLPARLNKMLDTLGRGEVELNVKAMDETKLYEHLQKVANRIALGLVIAALIMGAAMLMQIETQFTILGYPAFAMILFTVAVICGFGLVVSVFLDNRRLHRRDR